MKQTPAHHNVNAELKSMIPAGSSRIVEVGCMLGSLAQVWRAEHPGVHYTGIDIDADYARQAAAHCDVAFAADIETLADETLDALFPSDCWIFGDCLEHLRDPWRVLRRLRRRMDAAGCVVLCLPNAQHWSVQTRLATGLFRYEDSGLLDRTHLRWFTRVTLLEMLRDTGWRMDAGVVRRLPRPMSETVASAVRALAVAAGGDPAQAQTDAEAFQYVIRATPA